MHDVRDVADVTDTARIVVGLLERLDHGADAGATRVAGGACRRGGGSGAGAIAAAATVELVDDTLDEAARDCALETCVGNVIEGEGLLLRWEGLAEDEVDVLDFTRG